VHGPHAFENSARAPDAEPICICSPVLWGGVDVFVQRSAGPNLLSVVVVIVRALMALMMDDASPTFGIQPCLPVPVLCIGNVPKYLYLVFGSLSTQLLMNLDTSVYAIVALA